MSFKYRKFVYETGSINGTPQLSVEYDVETYNYVKVKAGTQAKYLHIIDGKAELGDLSDATPLSAQDARKYVELYRKRGFNAIVFSCSKKSE